jgi:hypothetical protein
MEIIAITTASNWEWDAIGPDLVVAATTGVFVGAVLLGAQAFTESRKARADSQFAWDTFKPKLSGSAQRSWIKSATVFTVPSALVALDTLAEGEPLALWKSHLKKPDDSLRLLMSILGQRATFETTAIDLDLAADRAITEGGISDMDAEVMRQTIRAHAQDIKHPFFDAYSPSVVESTLGELLENANLVGALERYAISVSIYNSTITSLLSALNREMELRMLETFTARNRR